ncbi:MAG: DUF1284 domain-containing protein [Nitrospiraceae bacterium]|nr:MAG: DUF1284 domain-containing protein [Nitrospiraceae bacterium]
MLRLRGHHLVCLHFFNGEGHDRVFTENLEDVLKRVGNEDIEICRDTDDVCEKCRYRKDNKCEYDTHADEDIREMDNMALALLETETGAFTRWKDVKEKIPGIFRQWYQKQCTVCDWKKACEKNYSFNGLKN